MDESGIEMSSDQITERSRMIASGYPLYFDYVSKDIFKTYGLIHDANDRMVERKFGTGHMESK